EPAQITCNVQQVAVDGTFSTGDTYEWYTFDGCINGGNTSPVITACSGGTYCLIVTSHGFDQGNAVECTDEFCIDVIENNQGPDLSLTGTDLECESNNNGVVSVTATPGNPNDYIYVWNGGVGQTITG